MARVASKVVGVASRVGARLAEVACMRDGGMEAVGVGWKDDAADGGVDLRKVLAAHAG